MAIYSSNHLRGTIYVVVGVLVVLLALILAGRGLRSQLPAGAIIKTSPMISLNPSLSPDEEYELCVETADLFHIDCIEDALDAEDACFELTDDYDFCYAIYLDDEADCDFEQELDIAAC